MFRLSTVVMILIVGIAVVGRCEEFVVVRQRSTLGAASYLFNPLLIVLAFTFITDPHVVDLLTTSS